MYLFFVCVYINSINSTQHGLMLYVIHSQRTPLLFLHISSIQTMAIVCCINSSIICTIYSNLVLLLSFHLFIMRTVFFFSSSSSSACVYQHLEFIHCKPCLPVASSIRRPSESLFVTMCDQNDNLVIIG